jgi:hypothetical protein
MLNYLIITEDSRKEVDALSYSATYKQQECYTPEVLAVIILQAMLDRIA